MIAQPALLFLHSGVHFPFLAVLLAAGLTVIHRQAHSRRLDVAGHGAFWIQPALGVLLGGLIRVGDIGVCRPVLERWTGHAPAGKNPGSLAFMQSSGERVPDLNAETGLPRFLVCLTPFETGDTILLRK